MNTTKMQSTQKQQLLAMPKKAMAKLIELDFVQYKITSNDHYRTFELHLYHPNGDVHFMTVEISSRTNKWHERALRRLLIGIDQIIPLEEMLIPFKQQATPQMDRKTPGKAVPANEGTASMTTSTLNPSTALGINEPMVQLAPPVEATPLGATDSTNSVGAAAIELNALAATSMPELSGHTSNLLANYWNRPYHIQKITLNSTSTSGTLLGTFTNNPAEEPDAFLSWYINNHILIVPGKEFKVIVTAPTGTFGRLFFGYVPDYTRAGSYTIEDIKKTNNYQTLDLDGGGTLTLTLHDVRVYGVSRIVQNDPNPWNGIVMMLDEPLQTVYREGESSISIEVQTRLSPTFALRGVRPDMVPFPETPTSSSALVVRPTNLDLYARETVNLLIGSDYGHNENNTVTTIRKPETFIDNSDLKDNIMLSPANIWYYTRIEGATRVMFASGDVPADTPEFLGTSPIEEILDWCRSHGYTAVEGRCDATPEWTWEDGTHSSTETEHSRVIKFWNGMTQFTLYNLSNTGDMIVRLSNDATHDFVKARDNLLVAGGVRLTYTEVIEWTESITQGQIIGSTYKGVSFSSIKPIMNVQSNREGSGLPSAFHFRLTSSLVKSLGSKRYVRFELGVSGRRIGTFCYSIDTGIYCSSPMSYVGQFNIDVNDITITSVYPTDVAPALTEIVGSEWESIKPAALFARRQMMQIAAVAAAGAFRAVSEHKEGRRQRRHEEEQAELQFQRTLQLQQARLDSITARQDKAYEAKTAQMLLAHELRHQDAIFRTGSYQNATLTMEQGLSYRDSPQNGVSANSAQTSAPRAQVIDTVDTNPEGEVASDTLDDSEV